MRPSTRAHAAARTRYPARLNPSRTRFKIAIERPPMRAVIASWGPAGTRPLHDDLDRWRGRADTPGAGVRTRPPGSGAGELERRRLLGEERVRLASRERIHQARRGLV